MQSKDTLIEPQLGIQDMSLQLPLAHLQNWNALTHQMIEPIIIRYQVIAIISTKCNQPDNGICMQWFILDR